MTSENWKTENWSIAQQNEGGGFAWWNLVKEGEVKVENWKLKVEALRSKMEKGELRMERWKLKTEYGDVFSFYGQSHFSVLWRIPSAFSFQF